MRRLNVIAAIVFAVTMVTPFVLSAQKKTEQKFLDIEGRLLLGGSYVTANYLDCYPEITDMNNSMGFAWGVGVGVKFNLSQTIGLGTELNYLRNSGKMDMAVIADGKADVSNVFIKNSYRSLNVPVYVSFGYDIASNVRWNIDAGLFFDLGTSGSQTTTIYNATLNDLGQLATAINRYKTGYYSNSKAFLNSYRNFDTGFHLATGLTFMRKVTVGLRGQFGLRNVALSEGIVKPTSRNLRVFATIGYKI